MASKKRAKESKQKLARNYGRPLSMGLVLLVAILFCVGGLYIYQDRKDHDRKVSNLEKAGNDLDVLKARAAKTTLGEFVSRSSDCYRTTEKFGSGWIVCAQRFAISGTATSRIDMEHNASVLAELISQSEPFKSSDISAGDFTNYSNGVASEVFVVVERSDAYPFCRSDYRSYDATYRHQDRRGTFSFEISCLESHLNNYVYDELESEY